ncbi:MAG: ECF transporter S component [Defluviitaleaceae bacterium]|nr:ECF transporter S component [Defluviitaleaceae bacterium]
MRTNESSTNAAVTAGNFGNNGAILLNVAGTNVDTATAAMHAIQIEVPHSMTSLTIADIKHNASNAALYGNKQETTALDKINLTEGEETSAYIKLTAEDGTTSHYELKVQRATETNDVSFVKNLAQTPMLFIKNRKISTEVMVRAALLGALGAVLMQFSTPLAIFPGFLQLDISDLPALVGAITTGPLTALLAVLIKNLLDPIIFGTNTGGIGNFANFIMGTALVVPIGIIYQRHKNVQGYLLGSAVGIVSLVIAAALTNYFILLPLFTQLFMPMETIIGIANAVNSNVNSVFTLILLAIVPFNLVKGGIVVVLGYGLYRALKPVLRQLQIRRAA